MKKSTLDHLITFAMVIVAYLIVQILIAAGVLSSLMQGLLVPMCTYSIDQPLSLIGKFDCISV